MSEEVVYLTVESKRTSMDQYANENVHFCLFGCDSTNGAPCAKNSLKKFFPLPDEKISANDWTQTNVNCQSCEPDTDADCYEDHLDADGNIVSYKDNYGLDKDLTLGKTCGDNPGHIRGTDSTVVSTEEGV